MTTATDLPSDSPIIGGRGASDSPIIGGRGASDSPTIGGRGANLSEPSPVGCSCSVFGGGQGGGGLSDSPSPGGGGRPTGPKTAAGKAISARNATTHGLFCRQTVLPHLGEDPAGYQRLLDVLHEQLRPRNLMETQYLELWADASWKMRRLSRLEAQIWENGADDEDALLMRLVHLHRLQGGLRRQMDRAVRMLSREVPGLFERRTREDVVAGLNLTESQCAQEPYRARDVERSVQANRRWPAPPDDLLPRLDNAAPTPPEPPTETGHNEICKNEPSKDDPAPADTPSPWQGEVASLGEPEGDSSPTPPGPGDGRPPAGP